MSKRAVIPDWEALLAHAALLQTKIPAAIRCSDPRIGIHRWLANAAPREG
ncbi:MAG: hypothetical protein WA642_12590 [Steroidobacteraceae bacterium]